METKLNLQRVTNLFRYELTLLKHPIILAAIGFALFITAICAMASLSDPTGIVSEKTLAGLYGVAFTLGFPIITSFSFHRVSTKGGAINYLSLPASREEKFLVTFLNTAILFPLGLTLLFIIVEYVLMLVWTLFGGEIGVFMPIQLELGLEGIIQVFLSFVGVHSFFFFGSAIFRKYAFLKTCILGFAIITVLSVTGVLIAMAIGATLAGEGGSQSFYWDGSLNGVWQYIANGISLTIVLILWTVSYLKFKRAEV
ncbi:hypothetical protein MY04_0373 [Flammeovirga sp. MY04]|uniref:hypothetical protein n=1 Tax=Flammeovirga sp. MY04 TaxID=1191459 RepID=UPI0008062454|nr:hypothetical protein [Flammeovirga sp. MY04]ANQ47755.1 hypothetical protein MY04_0373 [Flammeovirga sp. MY04]